MSKITQAVEIIEQILCNYLYLKNITKIIDQRLHESRHFIQVIVGPRQVGKTTAIQQILESFPFPYHYAAADLPAPPTTEWIAQQWDLAHMQLPKKFPAVTRSIDWCGEYYDTSALSKAD